ncbi:uncharacterized protein PHACADRAFT_200186 [Phanerochaete carnosa HHB-10118-sp]|uniref:Retrotransposon gag domain-containing protein n=1 Tax=Phanerochaete carnosa (strain HHB-10118-sp) TaxID=650164 RepID=K5UNP7_PHACS|nr:uncharacterized protein PHACADRAFT_200186 [Phanerochaete carnosa HHB-10118-sp]EKM51366.1 hypothetical protein PHACADRAFT_200186 [Phanerochaete carnosa HHB-10118-sp]
MKLYVVTQRKRLPEQFDRVLMILSYMKGGHAGEYVATYMKKYDTDEDTVIKTTNDLWKDLDIHFLIDEQAEAYDRLQAMQMGALSAQEFFSKFELCAFQKKHSGPTSFGFYIIHQRNSPLHTRYTNNGPRAST